MVAVIGVFTWPYMTVCNGRASDIVRVAAVQVDVTFTGRTVVEGCGGGDRMLTWPCRASC